MSTRSDNQVLSKEEYPEPKTKQGFPALIREVLELPGGVHRIIMERGQPVRVWRWTDRNDLLEPDPTLEQALASSDMIEYVNPDPTKTAAEELLHMIAVLHNEKALPVCWATGRDQTGLLRRWLRVDEQDVPFQDDQLLFVPVERLKSLPEDTLLLCGAGHANAGLGEVTISIKLAMELRDVEEVVRPDDHRVGDPALERRGPARAAQDGAGGDVRPAWGVSSFVRARLSGR